MRERKETTFLERYQETVKTGGSMEELKKDQERRQKIYDLEAARVDAYWNERRRHLNLFKRLVWVSTIVIFIVILLTLALKSTLALSFVSIAIGFYLLAAQVFMSFSELLLPRSKYDPAQVTWLRDKFPKRFDKQPPMNFEYWRITL